MRRILLVDDSASVRRSLRQVLADALGEVDVGEAAAASEALALIEGQRWDAVLLDLSLPDRSGVEVLRALKRRAGAPPVLVMSLHAEAEYGEAARAAGAAGYVTKGSAPAVIAAAVTRVLAAPPAGEFGAQAPAAQGGAPAVPAAFGADDGEEGARRLAAALHDDVGQTLIAAKIRLQLAATAGDPTETRAAAQEVIALVGQALDSVRRLAAGLRPPLLDDAGLLPAVQSFLVRIQPVAERQGLAIGLAPGQASGGELPRAAPGREAAAFRIVEEAVTNVLRHAGARRAEVALQPIAPQRLRITVKDDGCGFDPARVLRPDAGAPPGQGLVALQARARAAGGACAIVSAPGAGTELRVELPYAPRGA